jgi:DNA polymerase
MQRITLDFETYYDKEYSLKKLEIDEYVQDKRFKIWGVGVKIDGRKTRWWSGRDTLKLKNLDWLNIELVCHNAYFDAYILWYWFKVVPLKIRDTMSMGKALYPHESNSLEALVERRGIGKKGKELHTVIGRRDLTPQENKTLGRYCINDVDLTDALYLDMLEMYPESELDVIDITIRMFTEPALIPNREILKRHLTGVIENKQDKAKSIKHLLPAPSTIQTFPPTPVDWLEHVKPYLLSNNKFAEILEWLGEEPPLKTSIRTGKPTFAFSKTDRGFITLLEHENPDIKALAEARVTIKSTLEETRTLAFLARAGVAIALLLYYYGAHTGRFSGGGGINPQNLPRKSDLRLCLEAPPGYRVVVVDLSQIEARLNMLLAWLVFGGTDGVREGLDAFAAGDDIYALFASTAFGFEVNKKEYPTERFIGKTCVLGLGYQMSAPKLKKQLEQGGLIIPDEESQRLVDTYRKTYYQIPAQWYRLQDLLGVVADGEETISYGPVSFRRGGVLLPNGLSLQYKGLEQDKEGRWSYWTQKKGRDVQTNIYGGKLCENIIQALARIVICDAMVRISQRYKVVLQVHDEVVFLAPTEEADQALQWAIETTTIPPSWALDAPLDAEGGWDKGYSK